MNWAFVDYENVGSLENLDIQKYDRIFIFCGPKNKRIKFGEFPSDRFCVVEFISVNTTGSNNLDFHLAFHLGRFHEIAERTIVFHIISNDEGFNGLVNHLKTIGRGCKKVLSRPIMAEQLPVLSEDTKLVINGLKLLDGRKRPRKKASLMNWIKSRCQKLANATSHESIYKELLNMEYVQESDSGISYKFIH